jgi:hypothetical protein
MSTTLDAFFATLWDDYVAIAPRAARLRAAFEARGERVVNDHVAFRTLAGTAIAIEHLEPLLLGLGYRPHAPYRFVDKKLAAWSYLPPEPNQPRVFLSELLLDDIDPQNAALLRELAAQVDPAQLATPEVFCAGRLWGPPTRAQYEQLAAESEYAAWVAALGLRPNHFTISVADLVHHPTLESVLAVVESCGEVISTAGGRIKGSAEVYLEQASTLADRVPIELADGPLEVPTCYYEFALRHVVPETGERYQGFVPTSADRLFESTDRRAREAQGAAPAPKPAS